MCNDCTLLFGTLGDVYPSGCMAPVFIIKFWLCPRALRRQSHPEPSDSIERAHLRTVGAWVLRSCMARECRAVRRCASTGSRVVPSELLRPVWIVNRSWCGSLSCLSADSSIPKTSGRQESIHHHMFYLRQVRRYLASLRKGPDTVPSSVHELHPNSFGDKAI